MLPDESEIIKKEIIYNIYMFELIQKKIIKIFLLTYICVSVFQMHQIVFFFFFSFLILDFDNANIK